MPKPQIMESIEAIRKHFINELVHKDLKRAFYVLRQNVNRQSIKYDDLNILHIRYTNACRDQHVKGILSFEDASVQNNQIYAALLDLINDLQPEDLAIEVAPSTTIPKTNNKPPTIKGKILYRIPGLMEIEEEYKCIVRIAFTEDELDYLNNKDDVTKVEPVRISEVMSVQFIDESNCEAFAIRTRSTEEQFIDRGDFTEWIFYVKPLLEGIYDLLLKVSVVEKRMGREVKKDIVLEKKIKIVAEPIDDKLVLGEKSQSVIPVAAGAFPLCSLPAGVFEVANQPILLEVSPMPPLDSGIDIPNPYWLNNMAANLVSVVALSVLITVLINHPNDDINPIPNSISIPRSLISLPLPPPRTPTTLLSFVNTPIKPLLDDTGNPEKDSESDIPEIYETPYSLNINCKPHNKLKTLVVNVSGKYPPFKIFVNKRREATIKKSGDCFISYPPGDYVKGQKLELEVVDKEGNKKSKWVNVKIEKEIFDFDKFFKPLNVMECFDFDQFDGKCGILYLYKKGTDDNWKMRNRTFSDYGIVDNFKEGKFKFFQMDINSISPNCSNKTFTKLKDATTFVYRGGDEKPIRFDGFIEASKLKDKIACLTVMGGEDVSGFKTFPINLKMNTTYLYQSDNSKIGFLVKKVKSQERVRIAAFSKEENFRAFIKDIETLNLGYPMAIRLDNDYYKVYLGGFEHRIQAENILKILRKHKKLKKHLEAAKIKKIFVDKV